MDRIVLAHRSWQPIARALGFEPPVGEVWAGARVELARSDLGLRGQGTWLEAVVLAAQGGRSEAAPFGRPGPWRTFPQSQRSAHVCDLPLLAPVAAEDEVEAEVGRERGPDGDLAALIEWAAATATGKVPAGWRAPERAQAEGWLGSRRLVARAEAWAAQGQLVCDDARLALVFPELVRVPSELAPGRAAWLRVLCQDVTARWRLVRLALDAEARVVRAEVDLTGVPARCARPLLLLALEALLCAASWALPSLALVVDAGVESRMLERGPEGGHGPVQ